MKRDGLKSKNLLMLFRQNHTHTHTHTRARARSRARSSCVLRMPIHRTLCCIAADTAIDLDQSGENSDSAFIVLGEEDDA
jgi:hypothetical protein